MSMRKKMVASRWFNIRGPASPNIHRCKRQSTSRCGGKRVRRTSQKSHRVCTMFMNRATPANPTNPPPNKRTNVPRATFSQAMAEAMPAGYSIFSQA